MTMDRSLKTSGGMARVRSVLTRAERIAKMKEQENFDPEKDSPLGLPKTKVPRSKIGKKKKSAETEEAAE